MKPNQQLNLGPIKKLILHFDLYKTILISDPTGQKTKEDLINEILLSYAWGKVDEKNPNNWKLGQNQFSKFPKDPEMVSYKAFVDGLFGLKTAADEPDEELRAKYNKEMENNRKNMYGNFLKAGNPGIKMKPEFDKAMKGVIVPKVVLEELNSQKEDPLKKYITKSESNVMEENPEENKNEERNNLYELFSEGKAFVLPVFFKTVMALKKAKKEFAIVFRSFDGNLADVVYEFNKFCNCEHPCYNGRNNLPIARFDGSKNSKSFIINPSHQGVFFRLKPNIDNILMASGTLKRKPRNENLEDAYEVEDDRVKILKGGSQIYVTMMELLKESCALAFQDDAEYWKQNNRKIDGAKPFFIDQSDYSTLQIFFDDEITDDDNCVVDVFDIVDGSKIPIKKAMNKYLIRVDPLDLLKDNDIFLKAIDMCEKARLEEIDRIEKGIFEELTDEPKKNEWDLLQESSDEEYLRRTVMPILHPALKIVDIERPNDPISFIALYLLKNKEKVRLPPLPPDYFLEKTEENPEENENPEKHEKTEELAEKKDKEQLAKKQQEKEKKVETKIKK